MFYLIAVSDMDDVIIVLSDDESCTEVKMDPDEAALLERLKEK